MLIITPIICYPLRHITIWSLIVIHLGVESKINPRVPMLAFKVQLRNAILRGWDVKEREEKEAHFPLALCNHPYRFYDEA